ncbi:MAG: flagellar hook-associated protein FlgL [Deltaproteobacteria bacterium]|nr:flagellar hook-associated protein FlgL [Deltaproteobacteria bacterium]
MRIATKSLYDSIIQNVGRASTEMLDAQKVVTTGKKINRLSDDPVGLVTVLDLRSSIKNINQLERNISMGRSWLITCETSLNQTHDILSQVKELCVQYSSANVSSNERANAVNIVDGYLKQIISLANSKTGGRYIFGGTNTDTIPFVLNSSETQVTYSGNETAFSIKIGENTNIAVGKNGEDIFGDNWDNNNIFKTLIDLKTHLQTDNVEEIRETMDKLDTHLGAVRTVVSDIGGKTIRLDVKKEIIQDLELAYTERKSQIEDADIAEAIINLSSKELAYKASLASSAKIMALSLVDYL